MDPSHNSLPQPPVAKSAYSKSPFSKTPTRIVLADDHVMVRESLSRVLEASGEVQVVGQAGSGDELRHVVSQTKPECVVMDYSMPDHEPVQIIPDLLASFPKLKILLLTVHENVHYAVRTLEAGAHGYLIKSAAVEELVNAINSIAGGNVYVSKKIAATVWAQLRRPKTKREGLEGLSQREFEVLGLLGGGASLQQCADRLDVSVSTVSTYRGRLLQKLNLASTSELLRFAIEHDLADGAGD